MLFNIDDLVYVDDLSLAKIIISSADQFPGLYRFNSNWRHSLHNDSYLKLFNFLEIVYQSQKGKEWSKDKWLQAHQQIYDIGFGIEGRNEQRLDSNLKEILRNKHLDLVYKSSQYELAIIDYQNTVHEIELNQSYYLMGSLLHFTENKMYISYNDLDKTYHDCLNVSFTVISDYIKSIFSSKTLAELFFKSEIVAKLSFQDKNTLGRLIYNERKVFNLINQYSLNAPLFATVAYKNVLPIRFAKLIGVSNVLI